MPVSSTKTFLTCRSTLVVILIRLALLLLPHILTLEQFFPENWLYSNALTSVLVHPHQTLSHVKEAKAIRQLINGKFVDVYKASYTIRLPPLVLVAMQPVLDCRNPELVLALLLLLADIMIAHMIETLGRKLLLSNTTRKLENEENLQKKMPHEIQPQSKHIFPITKNSDSLLKIESLPLFAARLYFWSPITAMSGGVYCCFQNISALFLMTALHEFFRVNGSYTSCAFWLAIASYIKPHYCIFLVPLISWLTPLQYPSSSTTSKAMLIYSYGIWSAFLQGLSYSLVGSGQYWKVLEATYGCGWNSVGPNLSLQWYLHMQLFSRFRDYFSTIILGLPFAVVIPLTIRLYQYPMVLMALFSMIWSIFSPIQTFFDMNFSICFFLLCPKSLARMEKIAFFALCSLFVPLILNVIDFWMWLETNTGNANYLFFQCLAYNVFLSIIVGQFCTASLQRDKALRLTSKECEKS